MTPLVVYYDDNCVLCRNLAQWGKKKCDPADIQFVADQDSYTNLRASRGGRDFEGSEAWLEILRAAPQLSGLQWIAQKLGLEKATAKAINFTGHASRRLCIRCRT